MLLQGATGNGLRQADGTARRLWIGPASDGAVPPRWRRDRPTSRSRRLQSMIPKMRFALSLVFCLACSSGTPNGGPLVPDPGDAGARSPLACSGSSCDCSEGNCTLQCAGQNPCSPDCSGGDCEVTCSSGGPCTEDCSGSDCLTWCDVDPCSVDCSGGDCNTSCPSNGNCTINCSGGGCLTACGGGAVCAVECSGGGCQLECASGANCVFSDCTGGGCSCTGSGCS